MSTKSPPSGPVDHVESVSVLGAKIMRGTWPNGETHVLIGEVDYAEDPEGMAIAAVNGELPVDIEEVPKNE